MTDNKRGAADRQFRYRPNPVRQAIFVVLALTGIGAGYGIGYLIEGAPASPGQKQTSAVADGARPAPPMIAEPSIRPPAAAAPTASPPPMLPENGNPAQGSPVRAYEEALPKDVIEAQAPTPWATQVTEAPAPAPAAAESSAGPPPQQVAALPKSPEKTPRAVGAGKIPTWQRYAVAVPAAAGRPRIAIVIDDLGIDKPRTARAIKLRAPLTLSFMAYASGLKEQTAAAQAAGHELMMHIPMEPGSGDVDPGPNVLLTGIPRDELLASVRWNLEQFDGFVGVNNHMGSRFTADLPGMLAVMEELKKRDLLFLDSVTAGNSAAARAAHQVGVPFARRNIFLDHEDSVPAIKRQLAEVESLARRSGLAVAIGHPREATLRALAPWLDEIEGKGFQLVPVSAVIPPPPPRG